MDENILEEQYKERLEERIISNLAKELNTDINTAMDMYYNSSFSEKIEQGLYNIQYLDYKVLTEMLITTEKYEKNQNRMARNKT